MPVDGPENLPEVSSDTIFSVGGYQDKFTIASDEKVPLGIATPIITDAA
jgi:hypothetical protein